MYRPALFALLSLTAACSAPVGGTLKFAGTPPGTPAVNTGLPATFSRADVAAFDADVSRLSAAPLTPVSLLPTGTVNYTGQIGSNITLDGQTGYGLLGDLQMGVGFTGNRRIDGRVTDINLLQSGTPIQEFGGSLDIDGTQTNGGLRAEADGIVSLRDTTGQLARSNLALQLDGVVVDDVFRGDAVEGAVTGFGDGFQLGGPTVNIVLDGGGSFVGSVN